MASMIQLMMMARSVAYSNRRQCAMMMAWRRMNQVLGMKKKALSHRGGATSCAGQAPGLAACCTACVHVQTLL